MSDPAETSLVDAKSTDMVVEEQTPPVEVPKKEKRRRRKKRKERKDRKKKQRKGRKKNKNIKTDVNDDLSKEPVTRMASAHLMNVDINV